MHLADIIPRNALYWPDRPAVIDDTSSLTFRELEDRSNRLANTLRTMGCSVGDRVAILAWNRIELVEAEVALYKTAMVKVPLNARLSTDEVIQALCDSSPRVLIVGPDHAAAVAARLSEAPSVQQMLVIGGTGPDSYEEALARANDALTIDARDDDALAVLHYTSGSSGVLKAAMQTFGNRLELCRKYALVYDNRMAVTDVRAHVGPITHASGMFIMPTFLAGACNRLFGRFEAEPLVEAIEKEGITHLFLVPTMLNRIVNLPGIETRNLSSLRSLIYGAAPAASAVVEQAFNIFGPVLSNWYGAGETTGAVTALSQQDHVDAMAGRKELLSSCGRSHGFADVMVLDDTGQQVKTGEIGEIVIRGREVMQGYWNAPDLSEACLTDGAYHTGDLARVDHNGYIFIVDRKKEMIISGGFNVYPAEIENVLMTHPCVYEAAVVGVPDDEWGEAIKGVVVTKAGKPVDEQELIEFCARHLARFKKPASIDFVDELPKNANGKIMKRSVRDGYWAGHDRRV
jgi:acyl-CoA synthetase (AMP-forming)/AMP-acid ligase II